MDLKEFIKENKLEFNTGSKGDTNIVTLCGYGLYKNNTLGEVLESVNSTDNDVNDEIKRIYDYGKSRNYGKWWEKPEAKTQYKF